VAGRSGLTSTHLSDAEQTVISLRFRRTSASGKHGHRETRKKHWTICSRPASRHIDCHRRVARSYGTLPPIARRRRSLMLITHQRWPGCRTIRVSPVSLLWRRYGNIFKDDPPLDRHHRRLAGAAALCRPSLAARRAGVRGASAKHKAASNPCAVCAFTLVPLTSPANGRRERWGCGGAPFTQVDRAYKRWPDDARPGNLCFFCGVVTARTSE
jgi:hypothetical protein